MDAGLSGGLFEFVEVHYYHVDHWDLMFGQGGHVFWLGTHGEDAGGYAGVDGFDAAVEHFWKTGEVADVGGGETGFAQELCGASGRDEFNAQGGEAAGEVCESGLVGDAQESALDGSHALSVSVTLEVWHIWLH